MYAVNAETIKYTRHCNFDVSKLPADEQDKIIRDGMAMANREILVRTNGQELCYPTVQHATFAMNIHAKWTGKPFSYVLIVHGEEFEMVTE